MYKDNIKRKEDMIMKKILITLSIVLFAVAFMYGAASASIDQICSGCHTMHNSQDGTGMGAATTDGPQEQLLRADCLACHTGAGMTSSFQAPVVLQTAGDPGGTGYQKTNAGGDFYWVNQNTTDDDKKGHNVDLLGTGQDANIGLTPPGYADIGSGVASGGAFSTQLTCAGEFGCHGDHANNNDNWAGVKGAHHSNDNGSATRSVSDSATGDSYRFLKGINGLENAEWNWNETAGSHNEYFGEDDDTNRDQSGTRSGVDTTISYLCAQCHGDFHTDINTADPGSSPWVRHPTDIVLPTGGEYDDYNTEGAGGGLYSIEAPVARGVVPTASASDIDFDASVTGAIVMCLSCHRAHGSDQPDLLRWDYSDMDAGGSNTTGCFVCHTEKN
jgi:predicted CXXCH cytochrome family protein